MAPAEFVLCPSCLQGLEQRDRSYWERHEIALRPAARGAAPEAYVKELY